MAQMYEPVDSAEKRLRKFREVAAAAEEARSSRYQNINAQPKIQRVPVMFREDHKYQRYYEPRVTAIGPFHHDKFQWCQQGEKLKLQLAVNFVRDSKQNEADLLKKVDVNIKELRECYAQEPTGRYVDDDLALMLFVDGCSTLEFIYKYDDLECFEIKSDQVALAEQDIFLLENQLPYQLLKLLMSSSSIHEDLEDSIERFVLMHSTFAPYQPQRVAGAARREDVRISTEPEPTHLLELLRTRILGYPPKKSEPSVNIRPQSFHNVQELQAAGIQFRPVRGPSVLGDIYFKSFLWLGFLYLPKIKVDDSMAHKFMNLIAYEMCPDFQNDFGVTSYIGFLDSLINYADDVKHLRKNHILRNLLGSDEEVARLFNEIGTDLVPNNAIYRNVKRMIEDHYQTRWKKWMAQFFYDHFSKPWILAFIGVLSGLGLSAVQTWYSANSDKSSTPCKALLEYLKARGY
ncbi:hypothetical protein PRUPE_7G045900 [Prunus persica]|uniref:Uncharacterized protein n=1 Tax=Prunus persica TaxID=3760 RepID=A0A251N6P0_PRUPE|nr:uncharacterized protein LOC18770422 [Prunus persica]XP_020423508.1 uncharacterized protein LOC18770422 [Prunus persica]XP_020423509.1 uncharacterized protein LOC18770422 [Prunus persica]ONH95004.1 hypothetical protein PRUPE_7G045900 [Prunus persica]ONH95005.1 hypothetical protein PRUPE_7G045900 [Prunus persica]